MVKVSSDEDQNQSRGFGKGELGTRTAGRGRLQDCSGSACRGRGSRDGEARTRKPTVRGTGSRRFKPHSARCDPPAVTNFLSIYFYFF